MTQPTIEGNCDISPDATIFPTAVVRDSTIEAGAVVGSFTLVRDSTLGTDTVVGSHAEIARSTFEAGAGMHSGYVGDSTIGANSRLGAGTVITNNRLDDPPGENIVGATVGPNVRVGANCTIMPGVTIGEKSVIGPQTLVLEDVPPNFLVYAEQSTVRTDKNRK